MLRSLALSIALLFVFVAPAAAGDHPYKPAGISVYAPDSWNTQKAGDADGAMLVSASGANDAGFVAVAFDAKNLKKATKALDDLLAKFISDAELGKLKKTKLNGMKALAATGTGKAEGKDVSIAVLLIEAPVKGKVVLFVGIVETAKKDSYKAESKAILGGIKPL